MPLGLPVAGEDLLGQRRPVVGRVRLGADEADPALEARRAQLLGGPQTAQSGPDDEHVLRLACHVSIHPPCDPSGSAPGILADRQPTRVSGSSR